MNTLKPCWQCETTQEFTPADACTHCGNQFKAQPSTTPKLYTISVPTTDYVNFRITAASEDEALQIFHDSQDQMEFYAGTTDGQWDTDQAEIVAADEIRTGA